MKDKRHKGRFAPGCKQGRSIVISAPRTRATWAPDAPAVITKDTKFTVGPRFPDPTFSNTYSKV